MENISKRAKIEEAVHDAVGDLPPDTIICCHTCGIVFYSGPQKMENGDPFNQRLEILAALNVATSHAYDLAHEVCNSRRVFTL